MHARTHQPEREGAKNIVYDIAFRPDGSQLVAACGTRVLVYDAADGNLLHSLKGHKDAVHCVAYSRDGARFASGGADKQVIIWTTNAEGILKYAHTEPVQALAYNPMTHQLASATAADFGLWSAEAKSVPKHKLPSRATCASWTNDGQHLALGLFDGTVSIRDRNRPDTEKVRIERHAPIWSLAWNPSRDEAYDVLAVACWDQTLSFYQLSGRQMGKERDLGYDPCCVSYFSNGEYVVMGGSDRSAALWTKDGVKLVQIGEGKDWVWCCRQRPRNNMVAVGTNDGTIMMFQLQFNTVHGLYQERYAYRDYMTDVIVQHLMTDEKVRIKCRDYVKKIAVYRDRLAVQLPERVLIYKLAHADDAMDMNYKPCEKINKKLDCNLLVVTSEHVILCHEKKLQCLDYRGDIVREWMLEATIRYIKVVGGERGREGLLVGLESGAVTKLFVDNPFPVQLVKQSTAVRCLDLSPSRKKLAVVDENATVSVHNLETGLVELEEKNANSVAWNTELDDMICFSGNGTLSIKTADFPLHQQNLQGFVVGFKGSKIFCLHYVEMKTIDVPQSASLYQYLEKRDFSAAYKVACLGITESDWLQLGNEALRALEFKVARLAFIRVKDLRFIDLVRIIEEARKVPNHDDNLLIADVLAHQGKYPEAARLYTKAGQVERAIQMYTDLHMWDEARQLSGAAGLGPRSDLDRRQAVLAEEMKNWRAAFKSYMAAGETLEAIRVVERNEGAVEDLAELARSLPATSKDELAACAAYFKKAGAAQYAKEAFTKLGDYQALVALAVEHGQWEEAVDLARKHPQYTAQVYLPYAAWLALQDRFEEAQDAFKKGGQPEQSVRMLEALVHNAVVEARPADAALYLFLLAGERLKQAVAEEGRMGGDLGLGPAAAATNGLGRRGSSRGTMNGNGGEGGGGAAGEGRSVSALAGPGRAQRRSPREEYEQVYAKAEVYSAYAIVHRFTEEPFTTEQPETIFHACRFLLARITRDAPWGVSKVNVLTALAKQARALGANKLARYAFDKLSSYRLAPAIRDQVELQTIAVRARPFADSEELLCMCYRCRTNNPLLNTSADECVACKHPFVRSFATFDQLPLVRFDLPPHIGPEEALRLVAREPPPMTRAKKAPKKSNPWQDDGNAQILSLGGDDMEDDDFDSDDPFVQALNESVSESSTAFRAVEVDEEMLLSFRREHVFVQKWPSSAVPWTWWKNMIPELAISQCSTCNHFFNAEEWEFAVLSKGCCPFCRAPQDVSE
mmetsp:Transcript_24173/g.65451  ORF Transcript_24173/g.65451 Transcript_24173/m.65451 type:complete len:1251 (-) Transcript_24173:228-3980(-)